MKHRRGISIAGLIVALSGTATLAQQPSSAELYEQNCAICHAAGEIGTIALSRRFDAERAVLANRDDLPAQYIEYVVRHGLGGMPPFTRGDVTNHELEAIVEFLTNRP